MRPPDSTGREAWHNPNARIRGCFRAALRDLEVGIEPRMPENYYPDNNADNPPKATWRSHGHLLFANWLNYHVYQLTPYDLRTLSATGDTLTRD